MSTPYVSLYDLFLRKISDYSFASMTQSDFEDIAIKYLDSATSKFFNCKTDLTRDDNMKEFANNLTRTELEIISILMVIEWLSPMIHDTKLLKQVLTDRDFKVYSQQQHLKGITALKDYLKGEVNALISNYTYSDGIGNLK